MIGNLTESQIEDFLQKEIVGHLGCCANNQIYVVPISYAYDGKNVYGHTNEGLKVDIMRQNPNVCFEVDNFNEMANWQSVITWGVFEEISEQSEKINALKHLLSRKLPILSSKTTHLGESWPFSSEEMESLEGIVFKIIIYKKTGKYESPVDFPLKGRWH